MPIHDPHINASLDALPDPWTPPAPEEDPLDAARGLLLGWALSLALVALLAVLLAWCWR